jgi:choline-sulfatase
MREPGATGRESVFSEYLENEEAMIRTGRYKLIVGTGRRHRRDGYATANPTPGPYQRLYDLLADPDETTDVCDRPNLAPVVADLRHQLFQRLVTTWDNREVVPPGLPELEAITGTSCPATPRGNEPGRRAVLTPHLIRNREEQLPIP